MFRVITEYGNRLSRDEQRFARATVHGIIGIVIRDFISPLSVESQRVVGQKVAKGYPFINSCGGCCPLKFLCNILVQRVNGLIRQIQSNIIRCGIDNT